MRIKKTVSNYLIGFILSLVLTLGSYVLVMYHLKTLHVFPPDALLGILLPVFAVVQLLIQLLYFLHLGQESKPRLNLQLFLSTVFIVLMIVIGSIWIMDHLNYNMTPDINTYIQNEEGIHK
ncbi:MAG: cytochrome o ubiquinol oxidase subunit IV [Candidatus Levyibacteriota bacterium]